MCGTTYYTHEDVKAAYSSITNPNPSVQKQNVDQITAADKLIGEQIPHLGLAALTTGAGNPFETVRIAVTAGFLLGLRLSGTSDQINPDQKDTELVAEARASALAHQASSEAAQYADMAASAAAA
jgi:ElaB/YqjD/DUF883 family membrane-anchored ribosome-binding protein